MEVGEILDRPIRERQLLAPPPFGGDVLDDHRRADALDVATLEAVIGDVGGHERERRVGGSVRHPGGQEYSANRFIAQRLWRRAVAAYG